MSWFPVLCTMGGVAIAIPVVIIFLRSHSVRKPAPYQKEHPRGTPRIPGKGTPVFHGIRVVELSTFITAPLVGRAMAELGAEVIKVEDKKGDPWRWIFIQYEQGRDKSTNFEIYNHSKSGIILDLKKNSDIEKMKALLASADVFITNVRYNSLQKLGLDFDSLHKTMPHLVYAHLSAWGNSGPHHKLPGYDIGAFYGTTGMSALLSSEGHYSHYPVGFGDNTTGFGLLSLVATALYRRMDTGRGALVETNLFQNGIWSLANYFVKGNQSHSSIPNYDQKYTIKNPLYDHYKTKDDQFVALLGLGQEDITLKNLSHALKINLNPTQPNLTITIQQAISNYTYSDLSECLSNQGVEHCIVNHFSQICKGRDNRMVKAKCFVPIPGVWDIKSIIALPFFLNCSDEHGPLRPSPGLGEHTKSVLENGWNPRQPEAELPKNPLKTDSEKLPFEGVTVIELSDIGSCVSAACRVLLENGATVIKIEPPEGDYWRNCNPQFFAHLNRGKKSITLDLDRESDRKVLERLISTANVLATNKSLKKLKIWGLSYEEVKKRFPNLVYAIVTPWGMDGPEDGQGDLGAWWSYSSLVSLFFGKFPAYWLPRLPLQLGELISSNSFVASMAIGLFHQLRCGEGQLVEVSLLRSGMMMTSSAWSMLQYDEMKKDIIIMDYKDFWKNFPVATANCFKTKDNMWVQTLGVELERHLPKMAAALGIRWKVYLGTLSNLLFKVRSSKQRGPLKFTPLFQFLNTSFQQEISKMTWEQVKALFDKHDIWYCPINMTDQVFEDEQAKHLGIFEPTQEGIHIKCPLQVISQNNIKIVPKLGQHNVLIEEFNNN